MPIMIMPMSKTIPVGTAGRKLSVVVVRSINGKGITPDIEVDLTDDDLNNDRDPQLQRALKKLRQ